MIIEQFSSVLPILDLNDKSLYDLGFFQFQTNCLIMKQWDSCSCSGHGAIVFLLNDDILPPPATSLLSTAFSSAS